MKKSNIKNIIPLAIMLLVLTASYALASGARGRGDILQTTSIGNTPPPALEVSAEEYDPCGLDSVKCPDESVPVAGQMREITMYTSRVQETDSTPCISADGTNICKVDYNVCASNAYPFGTKLRIQGLGDCIVRDRMNRRYKDRIDWYAGMDLQRALKFGKQNLIIEIK